MPRRSEFPTALGDFKTWNRGAMRWVRVGLVGCLQWKDNKVVSMMHKDISKRIFLQSTWKGERGVQKVRGQSGLQVEMEDTSSLGSLKLIRQILLLGYLKLMVTDEMVASLVTETNRYTEQTLKDKELSPKSRFRQWTPVTVNERWAFLDLIIAMGLILIENLEEYWSLHTMYKLQFFSSVLKKDRFCLILSFLHIANNKKQLPHENPAYDPIYKIRNLITRHTTNFKRVFLPGEGTCRSGSTTQTSLASRCLN
ncbi:PiggyBac transposase Uribo1 [Elysia marginata]|uniref:PiggyBac transposase Uribo1 n=1 Tax=Elysia marginata TaxID=1093978 RepID=A0AAV4GKQ6_9GAST|nr:PiggyBac transposase Uribo1 [Elysia marginata]